MFGSMYITPVTYPSLTHHHRQQPWSSYALHIATLSHSLANDPLLGFLLHHSTTDWDPSHRLLSFRIFFAWLLFTKVVKLLPHFARYPGDICFLPVTILFGYCHGFIKLYALFTLYVVSTKVLSCDIMLT